MYKIKTNLNVKISIWKNNSIIKTKKKDHHLKGFFNILKSLNLSKLKQLFVNIGLIIK